MWEVIGIIALLGSIVWIGIASNPNECERSRLRSNYRMMTKSERVVKPLIFRGL